MRAPIIYRLCIAISFLLIPAYNKSLGPEQPGISAMERMAGSQAGNDLFDTKDVLKIVLKGKVKELLNDRSEASKNYPFILTYSNADGTVMEIPVDVKTRGHFRKLQGNCAYPPLLIQFPKTGVHSATIFGEQNKLKLVMPCSGDEYVVREWLVYKLYNLVTAKSFRARLVKVQLDDARNKKLPAPFYGILLEEEKQMAKRNFCIAVEKKLKPQQTVPDAFLTMAVFQYLIGNTDWSVQYLQNIKLIAKDSGSAPYPVPYDFDHAGIVNAPYANPPEALLLRSVRERRYRGYCVQNQELIKPVIAHYNRLKNDIYNLYGDGNLIDEKYIKYTRQYLDDFYETINNVSKWKTAFAYPCDPKGTGNVVIKGLKTE